MWIYANPNPCRKEEPDCVVRAISIAEEKTWDEVHWDLCVMSHEHCTMPSANWLWEKYLTDNGYEKFLLPENCPQCVTVGEFAKQYPHGTYIIGTGHHAVCVRDGNWMDLFDSRDETPTYFFRKKERNEHG